MSRQHEFDHAALDHLVESYHDERGDPAWTTDPVYGPHHAAGRGHLASDGRGNVSADEGTCASHSPATAAVYGGDVTNFRVLKIKVHPDDGWKVDPRDGYIKTPNAVPADRIVRVTRPLESKRGRASK